MKGQDPESKVNAMHIPDGFVNASVGLTSGLLAAVGIGTAITSRDWTTNRRLVPLTGVLAAFVFAAQMVNFPIPGGTSGHFMGGAFLAGMIGLAPAVVAMTCVVLVQAFLFADGGITALGANLLNMALISPFCGCFVIRIATALLGTAPFVKSIGVALGAWLGLIVAAIACALQMSFSGVVPLRPALVAMVSVHAIIGVGEALISGLLFASLFRRGIPALPQAPATEEPIWKLVGAGLFAALLVVIALAPLASAYPDGLEKTAETLGFAASAHEQPVFPSPWGDYKLSTQLSETTSGILAGIIGVLCTALALVFIGKGAALVGGAPTKPSVHQSE
jgi:cobalt/nickel transport system permease protein